jgi:hypothetical protein
MGWRSSQVTRSGFPAKDGIRLARRTNVYLHQVADLVARGCPPNLASRILL